MALPPLTPEQRAAALAKAAEARAARRAAKDALKASQTTLGAVLAAGPRDAAIARMRVVELLEALPGVGKARAGQIMDRVGIAPNRRVGGLGAHQIAALVDQFPA